MILSRPGWSGYMSKMQSRTSAYNTSGVLQLPFVNIDSNNISIMYTCILYVHSGTTKQMWMALHHYHIRPSILRNAREVVLVDGSLSGVVIRLGGFHLLFSSKIIINHIIYFTVRQVPLWHMDRHGVGQNLMSTVH